MVPIESIVLGIVVLITLNSVNSFLFLNTDRVCIPTAITRGPCHSCVCAPDGMFHCRVENCENELYRDPYDEQLRWIYRRHVNLAKSQNGLSQSKFSLSQLGPRAVRNHRNIFSLELSQEKSSPLIANVTHEVTNSDDDYFNYGHHHYNVDALPIIKDNKSCIPYRMYRKGCNTCRCTKYRTLICTKMGCLNRKQIHELKDMKDAYKMARQGSKSLPDLPIRKCVAGKIYRKGCQRCFCNHKKIAVCTNKPCEELIQSIDTPEDVSPKITDNDFYGLTPLPHAAAECEPGHEYKVDCNHCLCLANRNLLCGNLMCLSTEDVNRVEASKLSGTPCNEIAKTDTDCIKCTCVEGSTQCTPVQDCIPLALRRQLHGTGNVKPRISLDMNAGKCLPNMIYNQNCNHCYCQRDGSLRCTRKGCLNYQQLKQLNHQKQKLLESGL